MHTIKPDQMDALKHVAEDSLKIATEKQGTAAGVFAGANTGVSMTILFAATFGCSLSMPVIIGAAIAGGFLFSGKKSNNTPHF